MVKTDCKKCKGWYNLCSPDWFPDYITDPEDCEFYELDSNAPTSSNSEYKSPMAQSCLNCPFRVDDDLKAEHCSNYKCDVWKRA